MKKFLAMVLALTVVLGLCACGGATGNNGGSQTSGGAAAGEKVTLKIGIPVNAMVLEHDNNALTKWVESECNVELKFEEYAGGSDVTTQISTAIAARQELPDILFGVSMGDTSILRYGKEGYLLDLTKYFEDKEGASKIFWDRVTNELSEYDRDLVLRKIVNADTGAIYSVPCVETSMIDKMHYQTWINREWLNKLGLEVPTNNEELVTVLKAFRDKDPNGNGQRDEIPLFACDKVNGGIRWIINLFTYFNTSRRFNVDENGKLYHQATSDEYREALKFIKYLTDEKLLTSMAWTADGSDAKLITTPSSGTAMCGIFTAHLTVHTTKNNPVLYQYEPMQTWGCAVRGDTSCSLTTFITDSCKNPDRAFEVLMKLWSWDGSMRVRYGEYGANWTDADPGSKSAVGLDATYKLINDPMNEPGTAKWAKIASTLNICAEGETAQLDESASEWERTKSAMHAESYRLFCEAEEKNNPKVICPVLIYTEDEKNLTSMERSNTQDRIDKAMAEFCTGILDPNKDSDWEAYLKQINDLGLPIWTELAQKAYDRSK